MALRENDIQQAVINIKVLGVGGGGNNVLRRLSKEKFLDVELIAINSDMKQLGLTEKDGIKVVPIGVSMTKGYGTGGNVEIGEQAAIAEEQEIKKLLIGADMVFITAGMGGGFGTGAAPVIARIARDMGILSLGIVTEPFDFEGRRKVQTAKDGIQRMQQEMDSLIVVKNNNLKELPEFKQISLKYAFRFADEALNQSIRCIVEMIRTTGYVNVDFADVTTIFKQGTTSDAILGIGEADTPLAAVMEAIDNPLVDRPISGARGLIVNFTSTTDLAMSAVTDATVYLQENTHPDANIIFGLVEDESMGEKVRATVVATDFEDSSSPSQAPGIKPGVTSRPGIEKTQLEEATSIPKWMTSAPSSEPMQVFKFNLGNASKDK